MAASDASRALATVRTDFERPNSGAAPLCE